MREDAVGDSLVKRRRRRRRTQGEAGLDWEWTPRNIARAPTPLAACGICRHLFLPQHLSFRIHFNHKRHHTYTNLIQIIETACQSPASYIHICARTAAGEGHVIPSTSNSSSCWELLSSEFCELLVRCSLLQNQMNKGGGQKNYLWAFKILGPYFDIAADAIRPKTDFTFETNRKNVKEKLQKTIQTPVFYLLDLEVQTK